MAFIDWLRKQHEESARNRALFEGRPRVAASQAWGGYQDSPGGQRLMVRQREMPKVDNTLTIKDDGTRTHVKKWTDPDERTARFQADARATALPSSPIMSSGGPLPPPRNQRNPFDIPQYMFPQGALSPEAQAAIAQVQATGGQNVDAYGEPVGVDISNQRAMYHALRRPRPRVAHIPSMRGNIGATQSMVPGSRSLANMGMDLRPRLEMPGQAASVARSDARIPRQQMPPPRFVPPVDWRSFPQVRQRPFDIKDYDLGAPGVEMNTGNWLDNLGGRYTNWRQRMIEADRLRRQRGNY